MISPVEWRWGDRLAGMGVLLLGSPRTLLCMPSWLDNLMFLLHFWSTPDLMPVTRQWACKHRPACPKAVGSSPPLRLWCQLQTPDSWD